MKLRILTTTIGALLLAGLGILVGRQTMTRVAPIAAGHEHETGRATEPGRDGDHDHDHDHDHAEEDHDHDADDDHADDDHDHEAAHDHPHFSPEALRNMGVATGVLAVEDFVRRQEILGQVSESPGNGRPLSALVGGTVLAVMAEPGMLVAAGEPLLRYLRDPIPRPSLNLTGEILSPAREAVHESVAELRRTREEVRIFEAELERISKFTDTAGENLPVLPRQTAIDLRYQLLRARRAHDQARLELIKHGFSDEQIEAMATGGSIPDYGEATWRRALEHNGLWTGAAGRLFAALPEKPRSDRWWVATVAEIAAAGLAGEDLIAFLGEHPGAAMRFLEIGALLQQGMSVAELRLLHAHGGLEDLVTLRAPEGAGDAGWDVDSVMVQVGARIAAGDRLLQLADRRQLRLRIEPVGGEQAPALAVLGEVGACRARPLVEGSGPEIAALTIDQATGGEAGQGTTLWARLDNEVAAETTDLAGRRHRSWKLRAGLRYLVGVPRERIDAAFVLPVTALTEIGNDLVVLVVDGDSFRAQPVVPRHRDARVVVIPAGPDSALRAGMEVVTQGAYALGLALSAGEQQVDPHAGHSH